jgi:hypothetical protein
MPSRRYRDPDHGELNRIRRPLPTWDGLVHQAPMLTQIVCRCGYVTELLGRSYVEQQMKTHMRQVNGLATKV